MNDTSHLEAQVASALNRLATLLPGFRVRESQTTMMMTIVRVLVNARSPDDSSPLEGENIGVVEAPTGTGKSIGAILPAVIVARELKKTVVVSSATVALQEQLLKKDLPLIEKALGEPFGFTLAKGRGRYACTARAAQHAAADGLVPDLFGDTGTLNFRPSREETESLAQLSQSLMTGGWNGDRDLIPDTISDRLWSAMTIDRHACTGRNCRYVRKCPYVLAREKIQQALVVVANHDLVLADLKLDGGKILPAPQSTIYILDEAHNLPSKAVNAFSSGHTLIGMQRTLSRLPGTVGRLAQSLPGTPFPIERIERACESLSLGFDELMGIFDHHAALQSRNPKMRGLPTLRFPHGALPSPIATVAESIKQLAAGLHADIANVKSVADVACSTHPDDTLSLLASELGVFQGRLELLEETWASMTFEAKERQVPVAKWVGLVPLARNAYDYSINVASISAAENLGRLLWHKASAAILTSATLTAAGEFRMILRRTGLFRLPAVTTLKLDSPFDYQRNARLVIPALRADPKNAEAHTQEVIRLLPGLIQDNGEGSLVLFSSRRQMEEVYAALPSLLQKMVLMQGQKLSKAEILAKHCKRVDARKTSVIFGLDSFSEGVDLAGRYCTHVVIAKIPFPAPVDPVEEATAEWIKKMGGNPFNDLAVPAACIKIVQSAGRLLRTESDSGTVTILDRRLTTQRYGEAILASLPPFRRDIMGES